jgi:hypothetical protein
MSSPRGRTYSPSRDHDDAAVLRHVLLRNHRVGAIGQRRAGEDPVRFAGGQRTVGERSRRDAPGQTQPRRIAGGGPLCIAASEGVPVHRRVGPGRNVATRRHILGEHAMQRMGQLDMLESERGQTAENPLERLFDGDHADILTERHAPAVPRRGRLARS